MVYVIIFIVLSAYLGLTFLFLNKRYFPRYYTKLTTQSESMAAYKLARQTSQLLSFAHAATMFVIFLVPIIFVMILVSASANPGWSENIPLQTRVELDLSQLPAVDASGLDSPLIRGTTEVTIRTPNSGIWATVMFVGELFGILMLYILLQARNLFVSIANGEFFNKENVKRLQRCGIALLVYVLGRVIVHYLTWLMVISEMTFNHDAFRFLPYFNFQPVTMLVGISLLVFAGVMSEAVGIKEEQSLIV